MIQGARRVVVVLGCRCAVPGTGCPRLCSTRFVERGLDLELDATPAFVTVRIDPRATASNIDAVVRSLDAWRTPIWWAPPPEVERRRPRPAAVRRPPAARWPVARAREFRQRSEA